MAKRSKRRKRSAQSKEPALTAKLREAVIDFLNYHPAKRLSKNLRRLLIEYLRHQGAMESIYLPETLKDLEGLFDLLDVVEEEWEFDPLNL
jgi:hypothetical protein